MLFFQILICSTVGASALAKLRGRDNLAADISAVLQTITKRHAKWAVTVVALFELALSIGAVTRPTSLILVIGTGLILIGGTAIVSAMWVGSGVEKCPCWAGRLTVSHVRAFTTPTFGEMVRATLRPLGHSLRNGALLWVTWSGLYGVDGRVTMVAAACIPLILALGFVFDIYRQHRWINAGIHPKAEAFAVRLQDVITSDQWVITTEAT